MTDTRSTGRLPLEQIAAFVGSSAGPTPAQRAGLRCTSIYNVGYGSLARPMDDRLAEFGVRDFTLVDPKSYRPGSVASQCEADDVGQPKVEVGVARLARRGARTAAFRRDVFTLPDGLVAENAVIVASADNRRADIGANRLAARMRVRLLKVNIEPAFDWMAIRCFDFRRKPPLCCECQFSDRAYQTQQHPRSCDDGDQRHTAAPRWLSQAAGDAAALVAAQLADDRTASRWFSRQWQLSLATGKAAISELTASKRCRWDHRNCWPHLERLADGPDLVSLGDLLRLAGMRLDDATQVRFCQQVATEACCAACLERVPGVWWLFDVREPLGTCPGCGGALFAVPYWTYRQTSAERLISVIDRALAGWGVAPYAVVEFARGRRRRSFALGPSDSDEKRQELNTREEIVP